MKRLTNKRLIAGLLAYMVIVAVTFGFAIGESYHGASTGTVVDGETSPTNPPEAGYSADATLQTSPDVNAGSTTADAATGATPATGTTPSPAPDSTTGASPAPPAVTVPTTPPDAVVSPSPAPGTTPAPTPGEDDEYDD